MKKTQLKTVTKTILADIITPVSIFLKIRDVFPNSLLLDSSDYHSNENSYSFICLDPIADFEVRKGNISYELPGQEKQVVKLKERSEAVPRLNDFIHSFDVEKGKQELLIDGIFGYSSYDAVQYFEDITFKSELNDQEEIPEMKYGFYKYLNAINHLKNELQLIEPLQ